MSRNLIRGFAGVRRECIGDVQGKRHFLDYLQPRLDTGMLQGTLVMLTLSLAAAFAARKGYVTTSCLFWNQPVDHSFSDLKIIG
jgi:hypothetical protein